jgi:hypothetical protein
LIEISVVFSVKIYTRIFMGPWRVYRYITEESTYVILYGQCFLQIIEIPSKILRNISRKSLLFFSRGGMQILPVSGLRIFIFARHLSSLHKTVHLLNLEHILIFSRNIIYIYALKLEKRIVREKIVRNW